jgi:hypothetical protein
MAFYILLSTAAILTAVVGCALIWGYDIARAREVEQSVRRPAPVPEIPAAQQQTEIGARTTG